MFLIFFGLVFLERFLSDFFLGFGIRNNVNNMLIRLIFVMISNVFFILIVFIKVVKLKDLIIVLVLLEVVEIL